MDNRTPSFNRAILHLDLDAFFVEVERLRNPALRDRPLIVGGSSERGVVASCSYEARNFGIRPAMPIKQALLLCPQALVLRGDMEAYTRHSVLVRDILAEQAPVLEQASIDEFYLDLTGMDRYIGCWQWSKELRQRVMRESGLPLSLGLSINKTVSKVGAGVVKPDGERLIAPGQEKGFLAPMLVGMLPAVGRETARRLAFMGVRQCRTLSQIPPRLMEREFGQHGLIVWKKANGEDDSPVVPYRDQDSISTENTFDSDTIDMRFLQDELRRQTARLAYELRTLGKLTACVTVKLRYSDFNTFTKQARIPHTSHDGVLTEKVLALFERLYERRQLVRLVGVRFSGLVTGGCQLNLFNNTEKEARLLGAMDRVRDRFGKGALDRSGNLKT